MSKRLQILEHNKEVYKKLKNTLKTTDRTAIIQPTGTGKSYVALQYVQDNKEKRGLYLTSFKTIALRFKQLLAEYIPDATVDVALYLSVPKKQYDYIVLDEFHRCGAPTWGESINELLEANPFAKVIGMTATPVRYLDCERDMTQELFNGSVASEITLEEAIARGILKEPLYYSSLYSLNPLYNKMVARVEAITNTEKKRKLQQYLTKLKLTLDRSIGLSEMFRRYVTKKDGRYIIFCTNHEHVKAMQSECSDWFAEVNPKRTMYTLDYRKSDPMKTLSKFENNKDDSLKLLFCVDMLNEGVHVDGVDGVVLLRSTESYNVFVQQIGRAMAVNQNAPVIFDIVNNSISFTHCKLFSDTIKGYVEQYGEEQHTPFSIVFLQQEFITLMEQIQVLTRKSFWDWLDIAKQHYEEFGNLDISAHYITADGEPLGQWLIKQRCRYWLAKGKGYNPQYTAMTEEEQIALEKLGIDWGERIAVKELWQRRFEEFKQMADRRDSQSFVDGSRVSTWRTRTRQLFRDGELTEEEIAELTELGVKLSESPYNAGDYFQLGLNYLIEYKEQFGDCQVPHSYKTADGFRLGGWRERRVKEISTGVLDEEKKQRLISAGVYEEMISTRELRFVQLRDHCKTYYEQFGWLCVTHNYTCEDGYPLGVRLMKIRSNRNLGIVVEQRIADLLDSYNFPWTTEQLEEQRWNRALTYLKLYKEKFGDTIVPASYKTEDGFALGSWRASCLKKAAGVESYTPLTDNQRKQLNELGFFDEVRCRTKNVNAF